MCLILLETQLIFAFESISIWNLADRLNYTTKIGIIISILVYINVKNNNFIIKKFHTLCI